MLAPGTRELLLVSEQAAHIAARLVVTNALPNLIEEHLRELERGGGAIRADASPNALVFDTADGIPIATHEGAHVGSRQAAHANDSSTASPLARTRWPLPFPGPDRKPSA